MISLTFDLVTLQVNVTEVNTQVLRFKNEGVKVTTQLPHSTATGQVRPGGHNTGQSRSQVNS